MPTRSHLPLLIVALLPVVMVGAPPRRGAEVPSPAATYVLDTRRSESLVLLLPEQALARRTAAGVELLGVQALSARFLPGGDVLYAGVDFALRRLGPGGVNDVLPPGNASGPIYLNPAGSMAAYLKPADLPTGGEAAFTYGVAVVDLSTGAERVLLQLPGITLGLYGWLADDLVVQIPSWDPATLLPADRLDLARLPAAGGPPGPLASLPALRPGASSPQVSFDQQYLAYESGENLVVFSPRTLTYQTFAGFVSPRWTEAGLAAQLAQQSVDLAWDPADLDRAADVPAALRWPPRLFATAAEGLMAPAQSTPIGSVLLYRPVASTIRVSTYYDLDRRVGTWRTWTGQTGTRWVYGGTYDQHSGVDYDGVTGDPVFASATGTVTAVVVNCANTYPQTPSFGTYVRIDHGTLIDGQRYWTLYAHLKCDSIRTGVGTTIPVLPVQLASMGNTGWSTGDHTHLEVYRNSLTTTIDPYDLRLISDNAPIPTSGDVTGRVLDAAGQPAAGVPVKLTAGGVGRTGSTAADGTYHVAGVPSGPARLTAVLGARWGQLNMTIRANQVITAPDLALTQCVGAGLTADGCPALVYDAAAFVEDVTVPDGQPVQPSQVLSKTWRMANTGTSTWNNYQLAFVGGTDPSGGSSLLGSLVAATPGQVVDVTVTQTVPSLAGVLRSYWRLRNTDGVYFGPTVWLEVNSQPPEGTGQSGVSYPAAFGARSSMDAASAGGPTCSIQPLPPTSSSANISVAWSGNMTDTLGATTDVQFLDTGRGGWRPWLRQVPYPRTTAVFAGQAGHRYGFRCRITNALGETAGYPVAADQEMLVAAARTAPDLRITGLTAEPSPGGGVLTQVVVENQGAASTENHFNVDLYLNRVPAGLGDYQGSLRLWMTQPVTAGRTVTLTSLLSASSAEWTGDLYALADSAGVVPETLEDNNRWTSAVPFCVAAQDSFEADDRPQLAQAIAPGQSQLRNLGGPGEQDWVVVNPLPNRFYALKTSALGPSADTVVSLYGPDGTTLLARVDDANPQSLAADLTWVARSSEAVYAVITHANPAAGGCGNGYTLSLIDRGPATFTWLPALNR